MKAYIFLLTFVVLLSSSYLYASDKIYTNNDVEKYISGKEEETYSANQEVFKNIERNRGEQAEKEQMEEHKRALEYERRELQRQERELQKQEEVRRLEEEKLLKKRERQERAARGVERARQNWRDMQLNDIYMKMNRL